MGSGGFGEATGKEEIPGSGPGMCGYILIYSRL